MWIKRKGFGFIELITATVILAFVIVGFFAAFVSARKYINKSNRRIAAINYIRSYLSSFYNDVREDWYSADTGALSLGSHSLSIANPDYSGNYSVTPVSWGRRVIISVNYPTN